MPWDDTLLLSSARVDSLKIFDILKRRSLSENHARAVTLAIQKAESEIALDVKTAVGEVRNAIEQRFDQQLAILQETFVTKTYLSQNLSQMESRLMRWMLAFWVGQMAVTVGVVFAAFKLFR